MTDKIYIGSAKKKDFQDGGSLINIMLSLDGMAEHFKNYGFTTDQGKKKIKLILSERREIDQYGNSHYVTVDTWKPDSAPAPVVAEDDISF